MTDPTSRSALQSEFVSDTEMHELIRMFVDEMPQRIDEFRAAWERADGALVRRLAHQMKGAAPGYGFTPVGEQARALESGLKMSGDHLADLQREFDELIEMCRRVAF